MIHGTIIIHIYVRLSSPELQKPFLFLLKTQNTTTLQQVTGGKALNLVFKKMLELFLKLQENIKISVLKRRLQIYKKKKNSKQKLNR